MILCNGLCHVRFRNVERRPFEQSFVDIVDAYDPGCVQIGKGVQEKGVRRERHIGQTGTVTDSLQDLLGRNAALIVSCRSPTGKEESSEKELLCRVQIAQNLIAKHLRQSIADVMRLRRPVCG